MDVTFILSNFLPPVVLILSTILFLDASTGNRDVDKALSKPTSSKPILSLRFWQTRWRVAMGSKVVGVWSLGDIMMVLALIVCNGLWWGAPVASRLIKPPVSHHHHGGSTAFTIRKLFDKIAGWAGWAGFWNGATAILFAVRDNHLLKHSLRSHTTSSYHHTIRYHVGLGIVCFLQETFHTLYFIIAWAVDQRLNESLLPWVNGMAYGNFAGLISWIALLIVAVTSIAKVRRWKYGVFYWSHQLYIVFVAFALVHYSAGWWVFTGPILYFIYDRLAPSLRAPRNTTASIHAVTSSTLLVSIPIPKHYTSATTYAPGDWININVPSVSTLNWHPFSIASFHPHSQDRMDLYVKVRGGWTKKLMEVAKLHATGEIKIKVDGPFGPRSSAYLSFGSLVVVGGGTGMAALVPFVKNFLANGAVENRKVHIVWVAGKGGEVCCHAGFLRDLAGIVAENRGSVKVFLTRDGEGVVDLASPVEKVSSGLVGGDYLLSLDEKKGVSEKTLVESEPVDGLQERLDGKAVVSRCRNVDLVFLVSNVLLAIACFGGGVGGYVFGRIYAFDYDAKACSGTDVLSNSKLHFFCLYWYPLAPVLMAILFALSSSFIVLSIPTLFLSAAVTAPAPHVPLQSIPGGIEVVKARPDIKKVLEAIVVGDDVAVVAAGPERLVRDVEGVAVGKGVTFFRESFKV
ncbi:hypothetical protein HDU97_000132 [Phlyctochytrium planicorne]|nr:hypothetical protein HDU97_000132 [Phlyctochytrium planicorne]